VNGPDEGPERGRRPHAMAEHLPDVEARASCSASSSSPSAGQTRSQDEGSSVCVRSPLGSSSEVDVGVEQLSQTEVLSECRRPDQPGVRDAVVVDRSTLIRSETVRKMCASKRCLSVRGMGRCRNPHFPLQEGTFSRMVRRS